MNDGLDPREAARTRRRDRDAEAQTRALLRPGLGKVFKQILDTQARAAREAKQKSRTTSGGPPTSSRGPSSSPPSTPPVDDPADPG